MECDRRHRPVNPCKLFSSSPRKRGSRHCPSGMDSRFRGMTLIDGVEDRSMTADLFDSFPGPGPDQETLTEGAFLLRGFARDRAEALIAAVRAVEAAAPFRHLVTPGGYRMSVAMTNCGRVGWVSDRSGYRYDTDDPLAGRPWPEMPPVFAELADAASVRGRLRRLRARRLPDQPLRARLAPVAAPGPRRARHRRADRLGLAWPARDLPVRRAAAQRPDPPGAGGAWRRRGLGRPGAAGLPRHRHPAGRQPCAARPPADKPDLSEGPLMPL